MSDRTWLTEGELQKRLNALCRIRTIGQLIELVTLRAAMRLIQQGIRIYEEH